MLGYDRTDCFRSFHCLSDDTQADFPTGLTVPAHDGTGFRRGPAQALVCSETRLRNLRNCPRSLTLVAFVIVVVLRSAEFLGESDEKPFRPADVAEPIRVFILDYFAYELRAAIAEPFKRLVDVVHGEHDAEVA